ncbi:MAG: aldolase/citrate lyase family protein [Bryobacteraceae bacterium]|nr:aldolase/citrate lyase family protein [Bryobacteraceae bacterium]MDW8377350.1 aldolase/citrate lyase family protein [Bryobacterales bacterium]
MNTKIRLVVFALLAACWSAVNAQPVSNYKPKRINKAIELLEQGQPVYYVTVAGGAGYQEGKKMAQTWADYITYEMEHGSLDFTALREFMRGLVDGGPTKSGHRTPAVIATLPVLGIDEHHMRANFWVVQQAMAAGIHGILLCHARSPEAVRIFVQALRYPNAKPVVPGIGEGLLGNGSQGFASRIWGISPAEYMRKADPWPLNPEGEFMLGLKIEDKYALANAELVASVPGIAFAEWGPGDMGLSLNLPDGHGANETLHPQMREARARVLAATKKAKIAFLNTVRPDDVEKMIDEGVRIGAGSQEAAEKGRRYTKRQMPW